MAERGFDFIGLFEDNPAEHPDSTRSQNIAQAFITHLDDNPRQDVDQRKVKTTGGMDKACQTAILGVDSR